MTATTLPTSRSVSSRAATGVALGAFLMGAALASGAVVALDDDATRSDPASVLEGRVGSASAAFDPDRGSITAIDQRAATGSASAAFDPDRGSITAIDQRAATGSTSGAQYSAGAARNLWQAAQTDG